MKRLIMLLATIMLVMMLSACGNEQITPSTETSVAEIIPESTPEPTPELHIHIWAEADCQTPKTCADCGETEGMALSHDLTEANYQEPPICIVCGEIVGEPLTAGFDKQGIVIDTVLDEVYPFVAICGDDESKTTVGRITFYNLVIEYWCDVEGCGSNDCDHEKVDEWRDISYRIEFDDENAHLYGTQIGYIFTDFYLQDGTNDKFIYSDAEIGNTLNWYGVEYQGCINGQAEIISDGWVNNVLTLSRTKSFKVPTGYDGAVLGLVGFQAESKGLTFNEVLEHQPVFFRLK
ncbi:MAG: hypothetical protein FWC09_03395 [Lachnospiraceae bacterium]|nr:hypothetical protein [Lachnospiraceae bacterium]